MQQQHMLPELLKFNGLFCFIDKIVSNAALSAQIAKCMKLQGEQTLTGDITSHKDTYKFMNAKPSEIACLSAVKSGIQAQLNNTTSNYLTSSTASSGHWTNTFCLSFRSLLKLVMF